MVVQPAIWIFELDEVEIELKASPRTIAYQVVAGEIWFPIEEDLFTA